MAWQKASYRLTSSAPLIQHNGRTVNPLDEYTKQLKAVSSKRTKTDADHLEMARIEFLAGLYLDEKDGPIVPTHCIDAMLVEASKKQRRGKDAKAALITDNHAVLEYEGPRTAAELWEDKNFRLSTNVRVQSARVVRTRPIFRDWKTTVTVNYDDEVINIGDLDDWFTLAGRAVGIGDWRPQYGRFTVDKID